MILLINKAYLADHVVQKPEGWLSKQSFCELRLLDQRCGALQRGLRWLPEVLRHAAATHSVTGTGSESGRLLCAVANATCLDAV